MLLQLPLLHFIFFLLPLAFSSSLIAKPGCQDRCGNLSIPFPFGVGSGCSLEPSFDIICNTSTNPPKAYLNITHEREVIEINQSFIRVKYLNLALACSNVSNDQRGSNQTAEDSITIDLQRTPYTLSDANWLTAFGCNDMVLVVGKGNRSFSDGCISFCQDRNDSGDVQYCQDDDSTSVPGGGNGCCSTPIPSGTVYLEATLTDLHEKWGWRRQGLPCSYAFVVENRDGRFSDPLKYLMNNPTASLSDNPVTKITPQVVKMDWRIGAEKCSQARRNSTTYACRRNSDCVDFGGKVGGYGCRCLQGYEGNPYLSGGCRDIDECAQNIHKCDINAFCTNTLGSFKCSCRRGYYGDGGKDGTGCRLSKLINVLIGLGSGIGFVLFLSICFWLHKVLQRRKKKLRKEKFFKRNGGLLLQQKTNEGALGKTKLFTAEELETATDHYKESLILGQGGQGTVYKGMLSDGKIVAIKKPKLVGKDQLEQFINEVVILSHINHRNVVRLLGCCLEAEVPLLVYEFVPNGTLSHLLHGPNNEFLVSWNMRLKIAADIAGALAYLHSACSIPIYHRDIKSNNILLDEKYVIKVSDFGTSMSMAVGQTHLTTLVKGTFGYLDPEYFQSNKFTEKSDVYSFGVVLVELLTGQRPVSFERVDDEDARGLAARFLSSLEENNLDMILDPHVSEQGRKEEVIAVARLAQRCLNLKGKMRPTMKEVATELESFRISQISSPVKDESEEARMHGVSDFECARTASDIGETSSSLDIHPYMSETL